MVSPRNTVYLCNPPSSVVPPLHDSLALSFFGFLCLSLLNFLPPSSSICRPVLTSCPLPRSPISLPPCLSLSWAFSHCPIRATSHSIRGQLVVLAWCSDIFRGVTFAKLTFMEMGKINHSTTLCAILVISRKDTVSSHNDLEQTGMERWWSSPFSLCSESWLS